MIIAIIGAVGVRTPMIVQTILARQDSLGLTELRLMDSDRKSLELIGALPSPVESSPHTKFSIAGRLIDASH